jgi:hypothetical protein
MKKKSRILLLFIAAVFLLYGFKKRIIDAVEPDEIWSGTVSFVQKQTGAMIVTSEWKMEATITSNKANAIHSFHSNLINGDISDCKTTSETELSVGIDYNEKMYSIEVPMPGCYGKQTSGDRTVDFAQSDETAIRINDQPLKDPNVLEGTLTEKEGAEESGGTITTYTWHLERIGKKYQPPPEKNSNPKPGITGKVNTPPSGKINKNGQPQPGKPDTVPMIVGNLKKELWSGIVTWTKTSRSKGKKEWDDNGKVDLGMWDHFFEYKITANFVNGKGMVVRKDILTSWEKDSTIFIHPTNVYMIEERTKNFDCSGSEVMELSVEFSDDRKHYWVSLFTPACTGKMIFETKNNIHGNGSNQEPNDQQGKQITLPANSTGEPVGNNPTILSGVFNEIIPAPSDPGGGDIITRATWSLKRSK